MKLVGLLVLVAGLQACKIQVEVPKGGRVVTESGSFLCPADTTCEIDVVDTFFEETFVARANPGWMFRRWEKVPSAFCGDRIGPCALSTRGFGNSEKLMSLLESDSVFYLVPVFERIPKIREENLEAAGNVVTVPDGIEVDGSLELKTGTGPERLFDDARLELGFNTSGELEKLDGEGILPRELTRGFRLDTDVRAQIGYYTGAEINADDEIGITLMDQRQYLVFYLGGDVSFSFDKQVPGEDSKPGTETERVKISTPASGRIIMILDPNDDMIYRYGETPLKGAYGEAQSDRGLLPFVPIVDGHAAVDRFDGHKYKTVSVGVGIKALDVFNLTGEQVTRQPTLYDIDLSDPFNSNIAYRAGFNGSAEVAISVFGFSVEDLFEFDLAKASASFEVGTQRQAMTLVSKLSPDAPWLPIWVPLEPISPLDVTLTANGAGNAAMTLGGVYRSLIPRARLEGFARITPNALTLQGRVSGRIALPVKITFRDKNTYGELGITADFSDYIASAVDDGFDRAEEEVVGALARLEEATADYQFELSLRGLRESLPTMADGAINTLNRIPGIVYDRVYSRVRAEIDSKNKCVLGVCAVSARTRDEKARSAAASARDQARREIQPYIASMQELKRSALEDNDETLADAIETALRAAYAKRQFRKTFTVTVSVAGFSVSASHTVDEQILSGSQATAILNAADNVDRIPETSDRVISARQVIDRLPTQEIIDRARRAVEDGVARAPGVTGVNYSVIDGRYSAAVRFSDGSSRELDLNVLDWEELSAGISDLLADYVIDGLD